MRIFAGVVGLDASHERWYFDGDFNGDGFVDLAVAVRPIAARLGDLNEPLANWIVEDPRQPRSATTALAASDALLAIVHGYGPDGWRNPDARQTYVLKNTGGSRMRVVPTSDAVRPSPGTRGSGTSSARRSTAPPECSTGTVPGMPGRRRARGSA
jgi:hypothetical protein